MDPRQRLGRDHSNLIDCNGSIRDRLFDHRAHCATAHKPALQPPDGKPYLLWAATRKWTRHDIGSLLVLLVAARSVRRQLSASNA
jgi:hypothetical protein